MQILFLHAFCLFVFTNFQHALHSYPHTGEFHRSLEKPKCRSEFPKNKTKGFAVIYCVLPFADNESSSVPEFIPRSEQEPSVLISQEIQTFCRLKLSMVNTEQVYAG